MNSKLCSRPTHLIKFNNVEINILRKCADIYSSEYFDQLYMEKLEVYMLKFFKVPLEDELYNIELNMFLHNYLETFYLENQFFLQPSERGLSTKCTTAYVYNNHSLYNYQQVAVYSAPMGTIFLKYVYTQKLQFKLI